MNTVSHRQIGHSVNGFALFEVFAEVGEQLVSQGFQICGPAGFVSPLMGWHEVMAEFRKLAYVQVAEQDGYWAYAYFANATSDKIIRYQIIGRNGEIVADEETRAGIEDAHAEFRRLMDDALEDKQVSSDDDGPGYQ